MQKRNTNLLTTLIALLALLLAAAAVQAAVKAVPVGVKFTHAAPGAGSVHLAGSFNGWSADSHPLVKGDDGVWSIVMALKPGRHEYKFVVDGGWFADGDNPDTVPDSFGGANSLVVIGDDGKLKAVERTAVAAGPNFALNARVNVSGRYLGRYTAWKNRNGDTRYRMERPEQKVDLNFDTAVSEIVDVYTRLRLDNTTDVVLNNVHAKFDEGSLDIHPGPFRVLGFWDMETLQLNDPLSSGGDVDLPGTLLDDHLRAGKGTAGIVVDGNPFGLLYEGFFSDVHDYDYYGPLEVFDDTGTDLFGSRLSWSYGGWTVGTPLYMERSLIWLDLSSQLGLPGGTGLPALDDHIARTGDTSDWYEFDRLNLNVGLDVSRILADGKARVEFEWLANQSQERFVTGNRIGFNNSNGPVDVVFSDRTGDILHFAAAWAPRAGRRLQFEHTAVSQDGAMPSDNASQFVFTNQAAANNRVGVSFTEAMPGLSRDYTEFTWTEEGEDRRHVVWIQRDQTDADYGVVGLLSPVSGGAEASSTVWTLATGNVLGEPADAWGRWELEGALTSRDDDLTGLDGSTLEFIVRADRKLTRRLHAVGDLRWKRFDLDTRDSAGAATTWDDSVLQPWVGLKYLPHPMLEVTFAYGVDPLDFGIDYDGRDIGRWRWRRNYQYDNPGTTELDAENALADARAVGIRANMRF